MRWSENRRSCSCHDSSGEGISRDTALGHYHDDSLLGRLRRFGGGVVAYAAMFGYDALYDKVPEVRQTFVGYLNRREENRAE